MTPWLLRLAHRPGPTQVLGVLRIALIGLEWARYARNFQLFRDSRPEMMGLSALFFLATSLSFFGLWTRPAMALNAAVMLITYYYVGFALDVEPYTHHHTYLLMAFAVVMALTPSGRSLSIDRWLALRKARRQGAPAPEQVGNLWALPLLGVQLSAIYFWSAWDKCYGAFISGERMEHYLMYLYFGSTYPDLPGFRGLMVVSAVGTIMLEFGLAVALWIPRTRTVAIVVGIVFHALLYWWLPVGVFSLTMWVCYLAFIPPERVQRVLSDLS